MTPRKYGLIAFLTSGVAVACGASAALWLERGRPLHDVKQQQDVGQAAVTAMRQLREIRPIVTNLAEPSGAWVRVELALVISGSKNANLDESLAEFVSDSTDFLRTVTAQEIQGVNGLRRLREDLLDRARFRIGAAAEAVLIQTLVVQ